MTNPNGAKGKAFELAVFRYLSETFGRQVRRPHNEGFKDVGDIHLSPFVLQAKNYADVATALNVGVAGAELQAIHAEETFGVAVIKKRGAGVAEARVAMSLHTFRDLVARIRAAEVRAATAQGNLARLSAATDLSPYVEEIRRTAHDLAAITALPEHKDTP